MCDNITFDTEYTWLNEFKDYVPSRELAEAQLTFNQLMICRDVYRNDWVPDWRDTQHKYCITFNKGILYKETCMELSQVLSFQSAEVRDAFYNNFKDLIEKAKPMFE